jgi:hypothetical protein
MCSGYIFLLSGFAYMKIELLFRLKKTFTVCNKNYTVQGKFLDVNQFISLKMEMVNFFTRIKKAGYGKIP